MAALALPVMVVAVFQPAGWGRVLFGSADQAQGTVHRIGAYLLAVDADRDLVVAVFKPE